MNIQFGSGNLLAFNTAAGNTPVIFGGVQDVEIGFSASMKELFGQYQFPIDVARGEMKVTGKAKFANLHGNLINSLFFGQTLAVGQTLLALNEAGTIPATPFQITVANAATFLTDYGVSFAATGLPLTKVASGPATGQYSVSAGGVYTFAAADTTLGVVISYSYTSAASGKTVTLSNQLLGSSPVFQILLSQTFKTKNYSCCLYACTSTKLTNPTKLSDYTIGDFEFAAYTNASNQLGYISFPE